MQYHLRSLLYGGLLVFHSFMLQAQSPAILSVTLDTTAILQYQKLEFAVDIEASYTNPYDYQQIALSAELISPSGKQVLVDGFYKEGYQLTNPQSGAIGRVDQDGFFVRFSPDEPGVWQLRTQVKDQWGTATSPWHSFTCEASASKGFIRTGNEAYLSFEDQTPFIPIGHNISWPNSNAILDYQKWLDKLKDNGGNFFRLWHCHWGLSLEWLNNRYQGLQHYQQRNAFLLDWLHDYCDENDLYMMVCLQHHGQVSSQINPNWSENPYNKANGGMCEDTWDFFQDSTAIALTKNRLRYIMARWGYSKNIMAWELFNEVNWTDEYSTHSPSITAWHEEMAAFLKTHDPNQHLVSTSYASQELGDLTWTLHDIDFSQIHYYLPSANLERVIASGIRQYRDEYDKPTLLGEFGINTNAINYASLDPSGIYVHNGIWSGFFSGGMGTGASWWWDNYMHPQDLYYHYKGFSSLIQQLDLREALYPTQAEVRGAVGDLSISPGLGWGVKGDTLLHIAGGQADFSNVLSVYLYGSQWNTQYRSVPTFEIDYPQAGIFSLKTGSAKGNNPEISIWMDGQLVLREPGTTLTEYRIDVPAGTHTLTVDNTGTDWITVNEYRFENLGSKLDVYPLSSADKSHFAIWMLNHAYNHEYVAQNGIPQTVSHAQLLLKEVKSGTYFANWFDCLSGAWISSDEVSASADSLVVAIPDITWDLALIISTDAVTHIDAQVLQQHHLHVYPNPLTHDQLSLSLEWPLSPSSSVAKVVMLNALGQQVHESTLTIPANTALQHLSIPQTIPNGQYWLMIEAGKAMYSRSLMLQR